VVQVTPSTTPWRWMVVRMRTPATPNSSSIKIIVNGVQVTAFDTETYPSQNQETYFGSAVAHTIGKMPSGHASFFQGNLAQFLYFDGDVSQGTGEFNATTGQWVPTDASGLTFGTEGFHLDFADSSHFGKDVSITPTTRVIDYNSFTGPSEIHKGDVTTLSYKITASRTANCPKIDTYALGALGGSWSGVTVRVETDNGSGTAPSGTLVDVDGSVSGVSGSNSTWVTATFPNSGPALTVGTAYWVVISGTDFGCAHDVSGVGGGTLGLMQDATYHSGRSVGHKVYQVAANDFTDVSLTAASQTTDTPTNTFATWNPLHFNVVPVAASVYGNNLYVTNTPTNWVYSTMEVVGKQYVEWTMLGNSNPAGTRNIIGLSEQGLPSAAYQPNSTGSWSIGAPDMTVYDNAGNGSPIANYTNIVNNDVLGIAVDRDAGKMWVRVNGGSWLGGGDPVAGTTPTLTFSTTKPLFWTCYGYNTSDISVMNFGATAYDDAAPTDYLTVCTDNIPEPAYIDAAASFQILHYTGNASVRSLTFDGGSNLQPDLVMIKNRDVADSWRILDAVRGATLEMFTNTNGAEATDSNGLTSFDTNGFSLGTGAGGYNDNTEKFTAHAWKESVDAGFDIVQFSGDNTANRNISHSLGVIPEFVLVKSTGTGHWFMWHTGFGADNFFVPLSGAAVPGNTNTPWGTGSKSKIIIETLYNE
jgi:hypothetical protein